ncbi:M4 family metallopeptidase [Providencia manganoxydans]|uniref:M4 family metallopeptidase n=1 Tax=Providencia manganoxydans TaxID=2923283 RepID=UPI0034DD02CF
MSHILGRSYLPPYLVAQMYQDSPSPSKKSTLLHVNELMSKAYSLEDKELLRSLFMNVASLGNRYERIIRDAQQNEESSWHAHSNLPICSRSDLSLDNSAPNPYVLHMPHEDFSIIMKEGDINAPSTAARTVYDSVGKVRSFYKEKLGIDKLFGCDSQINAVIHYGEDYANAFWNSQAIFFGDGDRVYMGAFYNDIDIIGHELSHAFVTFTTDFDYWFQSGALNESVADVIGIMVKQYAQNERANESNWLLGENLFLDKYHAPALRSMKEPGTGYNIPISGGKYMKDMQVGHMQDYMHLSAYQDNGGVHINSGIPNKAFYLLATALGGYSWEVAGQIWVQTMYDSTLRSNATFKEFAKATINTANQKFDHRVANITRKSWEDVGLFV